MTYEYILFTIADGIARITLNRPDRLNSFTTSMHAELRDALAQGRGRPVGARAAAHRRGARLLRRAGPVAIARWRRASAPVDLGESIEKNYRPLVLGLRALPMPVVCAVNGVAAGAGANIALACDIVDRRANRRASSRRSARSASFPTPAARTSCRASSARRARWASRSSATSCRRSRRREWGLIWKCVDDAELGVHRRRAARAARAGADARTRGHQARAATHRDAQRSRSAARPRARPAARARPQRRLSRRRGRVPGQAPAALHRR